MKNYKDLPRVYANPINKELKNNKDVFYSSLKEEDRSVGKEDIFKKINNIFASSNHVYKSKVRIRTIDEDIDTVIVGKTGNSLLTLNGQKININEIRDINKI